MTDRNRPAMGHMIKAENLADWVQAIYDAAERRQPEGALARYVHNLRVAICLTRYDGQSMLLMEPAVHEALTAYLTDVRVNPLPV